MKEVLGIVILILGIIGMWISYMCIALAGTSFFILLVGKIFGFGTIYWFAWVTSWGVFTTPIYMLVCGFLAMIFNFLVMALGTTIAEN